MKRKQDQPQVREENPEKGNEPFREHWTNTTAVTSDPLRTNGSKGKHPLPKG